MPRNLSKEFNISAAVLAALSFFALFYNLGGGSLASWDEAIYASVAKEILKTGDWIRLRYAGALWFDKPPLVMWATAFAYKVLGVTEFSSRLTASLCGVGTVWMTYLLGRRLWGDWAGFCGAAALLSSSFFIRTARFATLDSPLVFLMSAMFYFFWRGRERPVWFVPAGVAFGLAILAKGFAAFAVVPVILIFIILSGEWRILKRTEFWGGLLAAFLIALPWHLVQWLEFRDAFWRDVVVKHLFSRTTQAVEGHTGNAYFYIRALLNKFRPAIFAGAVIIPWFLWKTARVRTPDYIFISSWAVSVFALATAVQTKLDWYIFPALPPLSLMVGWGLARMAQRKFFWAVAAVTALSVISHGFYSHRFDQDYSPPIKALAAQVKSQVPPGKTVYLIRYHEDPAVTFYWERFCQDLDEEKALETALAKGSFYGLIRKEDYVLWKGLFDRSGVSVAQESFGFYWVTSVV